MTITSDSATNREKEIRTEWPVTEGLTAGTEKQEGTQINLVAEGELDVSSTVPEKEHKGLD